MVDANQVWEVGEAIANMQRLAEYKPWWIEEPLSPDDVLGHAKVAEAVRPLGIGTRPANCTQIQPAFGIC